MQRQQSKRAYQFFMLTLAFMLAMLLSMACYRAPLAHATGGVPTIVWHQNLTTPGRYNGYPWGTPNEDVYLYGQNFPVGQQLKLVLAAGNSNSDPTVCNHGLVSVTQVTTRSDGFYAYFPWPLTLNKVNQEYSMCSLAKNGTVVSSRNEPGPFVVATANPPDIDVWPTTVAAGGTLTVTGHDWVLPHDVMVNFFDPNSPTTVPGARGIKVIYVTTSEIKNGRFRISFTIPKNLPPGNYNVVAGIDLFVVGVSSRSIKVVVTAAGK